MPPLLNLARRARAAWAAVEAALWARPLLWAVVLSAVIAAFFALALSPGYETNDDVAMQSAVDGTLGESFPHLVFGNVLIGLLLSTLYRIVDYFPWYGLYLYLAHFASLLTIIYVVLSDRRERLNVRLLALGGVLAVFHLSMWMQLQFTSTAILLGASGVALFFAVADRARTPWAAIAAAGAMVGFSSWIRWHSAWAVVLLALPPIVLSLRRLPWRRLAAFIGTAAVIVLVGSVAQGLYYAGQPDWQTYFAINAPRDRIQASPVIAQLDPAVLEEVGWSPNDFRMFRRWFFADPSVHEAGDIEAIAAALPSSFQTGSALTDLAAQARGWPAATRLLVVAAVAGLVCIGADRRTWTFILVSAASAAAMAFVLAGTLRLPGRVAVPILAFLPILCFAVHHTKRDDDSADKGATGKAWRVVTALVSVGALVVGGANAWALDREHHAADAVLRHTLSGLAAVDPDGLFVLWANRIDLSGQSLSPWRQGGLGGPQIIFLGWPQRSPMHEAVLARFDIDDLYTALAVRPDVYLPLLIQERESGFLRYLAQHYDFHGLLRPAARVGEHIVYNLVTSFKVDAPAGALVERRLDGSTNSYQIVPAGGLESAFAIPFWRGGLLIAGSADADLIVVTLRGQAIALARPDPASGGGTGAPGFALTVWRGGRSLRVFALSGNRAAEITP